MATYFNDVYKMMDSPAYNATPVNFKAKSKKATYNDMTPEQEINGIMSGLNSGTKTRKLGRIGLALLGVAGLILALKKGKGIKAAAAKLFKKKLKPSSFNGVKAPQNYKAAKKVDYTKVKYPPAQKGSLLSRFKNNSTFNGLKTWGTNLKNKIIKPKTTQQTVS